MFVGKFYILAVTLIAAVLLGAAGLLVGQAVPKGVPEGAGQGDQTDRNGVDRYGDPLPPGAVARLGTVRYRFSPAGSAFLPDGKTVVSTGQGNTINLWDARTGRLARTLHTGNFPLFFP